MLNIKIDGMDQLQRHLAGLERTELNKAIAAGINRTARAVEQNLLVGMESHLDRPTPFTLNSIGIQAANSKHLDASIYIKPIQAAYLRTPIEGGDISGSIVPVISNARLNPFGNIPGKRRGLAGIKGNNKRRFIKRIGLTTAVWERRGPALKAIAFIDRTAPRRAVFPFFQIGQRVAEQRLERDVAEAVSRVLKG